MKKYLSFLLIALVFTQLLIAPILHAQKTYYRIIIPKENIDIGRYGLIVLLEGDRYTSFVYEKTSTQTMTMCTDYFVQSMASLLAINLEGKTYVQCSAGHDEVIVEYKPKQLTFSMVIPTSEGLKVINITDYRAYIANLSGFGYVVRRENDTISFTVKEATGSSAGGFGDWLSALGGFFRVIWDSIRLLGYAVVQGAQAFGAVIEALKATAVWIGRPGDPEAVAYYNLYRMQLSALAVTMNNETVVQEVLDCRKPINATLHLIAANRTFKYTDKTLCEIYDMQPMGIIGALQVAFTTVSAGSPIVIFIAQNFLLLNAAIFSLIFIHGAYETVKTGSLRGIERAVLDIYRVLKFYWSVVKFIAELIWRVIQVVANFIEAILPF